MTWTGIEFEYELPQFPCIGCWKAADTGDELRAHVQVCSSWSDATADQLGVGDHVWIEMDDFIGPRTLIRAPAPAIGGGIGFECYTSEPDEEFIVIAEEDEVLRVVFAGDDGDFDEDEDEVFVDEPYVREQPPQRDWSHVPVLQQRPAHENDPVLESLLDEVVAYEPDFNQVEAWIYLSNVRRDKVPSELKNVVHEIVNDRRYDGAYDSPIPQLIADKHHVCSADRGVVNSMAGDVRARTVGKFMLDISDQITDRLLEDPAQEHLTRRKDIDNFVATRLEGSRPGLVGAAQVIMVMKTSHRRNA